ncbi:MAG: hypothetical protein SOI24_01055 [Coriobacteriales bacterium]
MWPAPRDRSASEVPCHTGTHTPASGASTVAILPRESAPDQAQ